MSETDKLLRERLIASGQLRPNTKELEPVQLNPGAVVFRIQSDEEFMALFRSDVAYAVSVLKGYQICLS